MTESIAQSKRSVGLIYGSITALAMIVFMTILYRGGVSLFLGKFGYLGTAAYLTIAVLACLAQKRQNNGVLSFSQALKTAFLIIFIGMATQTAFNYVVLNFIDTGFKAAVTSESLHITEKLLHTMGMTEDQIDRAIAEEKGRDQFALGPQLLGLAIYCIVGFIFALIIAAIVKKKQSAFEDFGS